MIYDRADWHYKGDYPSELPPENGGTHIGIFFSWLLDRHMESEQMVLEFSEVLDGIRNRQITGREFLLHVRDGQLASVDMTEQANAFAHYYYDSDIYFNDYAQALASGLPSLYHVEDNWENYTAMAAILDARFTAWSKARQRPWWRFWQPRSKVSQG